jgi:hypothetical protein
MSVLMGVQTANLLLRFILELCVLAVVGYWGFIAGNQMLMKWILGIGSPLIIAIVWGLMGAPKASIQVSVPFHFLLEVIVFGIPLILLIILGKINLAILYGTTVILNRIFMYVWNQ